MKTNFLRVLTSFLLVFALGFGVQAQTVSGTVTDENGCEVSMSFEIFITLITALSISTDWFDGDVASLPVFDSFPC